MKTKLLFSATFLLTSFFISAQAVITTVEDAETFDLPAIPNVVPTADTGTFTDKTTYFQLRGSASLTDDLSGDIKFDLATASGSVDGTLGIRVRKFRGTKLDIKVSVAGYTDESFSLPAETVDVGLNEFIDIEFAQKVTFTDSPLSVTIDIVELDKANYEAVVLTQIYSITIDKTVPLSTDDYTKSSFAVYPNPVINSFRINTAQDIKSVQVYSINGRLLKTLKSAMEYDISDLSSGLYLATINTLSGSETIKILKK